VVNEKGPSGLPAGKIREEMEKIRLESGNPGIGKKIVFLNFPASSNIMAIKRGEQFIQPTGSTVLEEGDILYVLAKNDAQLTHITRILKG
jgi:cell volume regulation protein A